MQVSEFYNHMYKYYCLVSCICYRGTIGEHLMARDYSVDYNGKYGHRL